MAECRSPPCLPSTTTISLLSLPPCLRLSAAVAAGILVPPPFPNFVGMQSVKTEDCDVLYLIIMIIIIEKKKDIFYVLWGMVPGP